jgi:acetyl-CoA C-acetyltransferase
MQKIYIVSAVRTPMGSFGGSLAKLSAIELGSTSMKGALASANVKADLIDEVYFGNVCQANLGQAPARQAAMGAGIPNKVPCTTVNKVCSSGMKSVMLGAQSIMLGHNDIVMTGGMESMSNIPHYLPQMRWGKKYGAGGVVDGLEKDGLRDAYGQMAMGVCADATAEKTSISREEQDRYTIQSYTRAKNATESGAFKNEIIPVSVPQRKGDPILVDTDEEFSKVNFEKIPKLRPAFTKEGTVTAANASTINDGASALILASEEKVKELGLKPIAEILSFADAAHEPEWFTTAPTLAVPIALKRAGLSMDDVDFFEINEAFAIVTMAFNQEFNISEDKVNVNGGAVALGHPLGASGARILTTLAHVLDTHKGKIGCAALCNGGGGASAVVIQKV